MSYARAVDRHGGAANGSQFHSHCDDRAMDDAVDHGAVDIDGGAAGSPTDGRRFDSTA